MGPIYNALGNPVTPESLEKAYAMGLIRKEDLVHGQAYKGVCRNAGVAVWHAPSERFLYVRHKFSHIFVEDIVHPEDDDGFDIFVPESIQEDYKIPEELLETWYRQQNRGRANAKWRRLHPELKDFKAINAYFNNDYDARNKEMDETSLDDDERYVEFERTS